MKKFITIVSTVLVLCCAVCLFVACKDDSPVIDKDTYKIEEKAYVVGDTFSTGDVVITANLKNGEQRKIDTHLKFDKSGLVDAENNSVLDDNNKFTKAGTYTVVVYLVEEREDMLVGDWKITVTEE